MDSKPDHSDFDFDYVIVGSGFGGSVSAMRLAEKGYSVCVIERGKRYRAEDFAKTNWDLRRFLWMPLFRCFGIQSMSLFRNVLVLGGTGVGGGSLVYANTLLMPGDAFFSSPVWKDLADWKAELEPHYATARRMLGVTVNTKLTFVDHLLKECADEMGQGHTFEPTEVAVYFGEPGKTVPDPYFGGKGPDRTGCIHCGGCMVGCRYNAKNTLDKNYLYFAEKAGARVLPETKAVKLRPMDASGREPGYFVDTENSTAWFRRDRRTIKARNVILSAGVLGTLDLLLRCKRAPDALPRLSERLGYGIRTNSEAFIGVSEPRPGPEHDYSHGIAIASSFYADEHTHIQPVRYPKRSDFMRFLSVPMVNGAHPLVRPVMLLFTILTKPLQTLKLFLNPDWASNTIILMAMQTLDTKMRFRLGRDWSTLFRKRMTTAPEEGSMRVPSYIPAGNEVAKTFAKKVGGIPQSAINEVLLDIPMTAHILGGCGIGATPKAGVIDAEHRVHGYTGLYVCDGSVIPTNLGVNPSLTITAMTERAMSKIPAKGKRLG